MDAPAPPFRTAWWVLPGSLMAGPYPGHGDPAIAARQLGALLDCGLRTFVDLMAEEPRWGWAPYEPRLRELAAQRGVAWRRVHHPVEDCDVPAAERLDAILADIDGSLEQRSPVYLHCWGGLGRTGTVAGIQLVRRGLATPDDFVEVMARLRAGAPGRSPETDEQVAYVRDWARGLPRNDASSADGRSARRSSSTT